MWEKKTDYIGKEALEKMRDHKRIFPIICINIINFFSKTSLYPLKIKWQLQLNIVYTLNGTIGILKNNINNLNHAIY